MSAEITECLDCSVSLYYYSAEKILSDIPFNLFASLGGAVVGFTHTIQFTLPYPFAWLMVRVNSKQQPMRLERLTLTSMYCPQVRLDNTVFPETLVTSKNLTVNGVCDSHPESVKTELICSPQGKWFSPNGLEPLSACFQKG